MMAATVPRASRAAANTAVLALAAATMAEAAVLSLMELQLSSREWGISRW